MVRCTVRMYCTAHIYTLTPRFFLFFHAWSLLYGRVCPSVRPLVRLSVLPIGRQAFLRFFEIENLRWDRKRTIGFEYDYEGLKLQKAFWAETVWYPLLIVLPDMAFFPFLFLALLFSQQLTASKFFFRVWQWNEHLTNSHMKNCRCLMVLSNAISKQQRFCELFQSQ